MAPNRLFWLPSLITAVVVHGLVVLVFTLVSSESPPGAQAKGVGGLKVGYAGGGSRSQSATLVATRQSQSVIKPVAVAAVRPKVQKQQVIKPVVAKQVVQKNPSAVVLKRAVSSTEPMKGNVTTSATVVATSSGTEQSQPGQGDGVGSHAKGSGDSAQGGGRPGVIRDYRSAIRAWLEQHKRYPKRALRRRQQGVAMLYFEIDRNGHVIMHEIRHSSGYAILDRAVHAMLRRALPLPEAPPEISTGALKFTVPIAFNIE